MKDKLIYAAIILALITPFLLFFLPSWYYALIIGNIIYSVMCGYYIRISDKEYSTTKSIIIPLIFNLLGFLYVLGKIRQSSKWKDPDNTLPNWFDGTIYEDGDNLINPNTGKSILLDKYELSMYDLIMGINYMGDHRGWDNEMIEFVKKGQDWFKKKNPKAFEILLKSEAIIINKALERRK